MTARPRELDSGHETVSVERYVLGRGLSDTGSLERWYKCIHCYETRPTYADFSESCPDADAELPE